MVRIEPIRDRPSFKCILAWRCVWFSLALPSSLLKGFFSWISTQLYHSFSWPLSILIFIYILEGATLSYLLHFSFFFTSSAWNLCLANSYCSSALRCHFLGSLFISHPILAAFLSLMLLQCSMLSHHCTVVLCGVLLLA